MANTPIILKFGFLAVVVAIGFWLGGYVYFRASDDWMAIKQILSESDVVTERVGGVEQVVFSPFDFTYRHSGDWAEAVIDFTASGTIGEADFSAKLERRAGLWSASRITEEQL